MLDFIIENINYFYLLGAISTLLLIRTSSRFYMGKKLSRIELKVLEYNTAYVFIHQQGIFNKKIFTITPAKQEEVIYKEKVYANGRVDGIIIIYMLDTIEPILELYLYNVKKVFSKNIEDIKKVMGE